MQLKNKAQLLIRDLGELGLIERIKGIVGCKDPSVLVSIGDDAAVVRPDCECLQLLTTDILVEDVHFKTSTYTPFEIGYKSIVVNVSDIAAMAGLPRYALVTLGVDPSTPLAFVDDLYKGMNSAAQEYGLALVGGDTTRSERLILNVTVAGLVEESLLKKRSGARAGELIGVTGELGGSAAGLFLLSNPELGSGISGAAAMKRSHIAPRARVREARVASEEGASAIEDISDGLAGEVKHICAMSSVGAVIRAGEIPFAAGVDEVAQLAGTSREDLSLFGGEDYELVFTAPKTKFEKIKRVIFEETGTKVAKVGETVSAGQGIKTMQTDGRLSDLRGGGFEHF